MNIDGKVSVIMPAYDEASHITHSIEETIKALNEMGCDFEIIVVDDGSRDDTFERAQELAKKYNNVIVRQNRINRGKGRALKFGFKFATGKYVVFLDADLDLHPAQISTFFDIMELDKADVVIGWKTHPNSIIKYPLHRRIISWFYFFWVNWMFALPFVGLFIHDTQTGLKLFKYEVLERVFPKILVKHFAYDLEILVNAHRLGYRITEAPVVLDSNRALSLGHIDVMAICTMFIDTLAIWYRMYILKYYDRVHNNNL